MNKLEYIPGDLAFHYIPKTIIKKYVKVYVCSTQNALSLEDMDGHLYDYIGELYPIPLTPEILEKNGWKHKKEFGEYWFVPRNEDYELLALDKVGEEWTIYIEGNSSNFENIKFVHQLQHLLFGLGLNSDMEV